MSTVEQPQVRRTLLLAIGSLAVLAVVWLLVLGPMLTGSGEEDDFAIPRREPQRAETPAAGDDADRELYPESYDVFAARDPFQQLVPEGTGSGAGSPLPPAVAPIGGSSGGSSGGTSGGTSGGASPSPATGGTDGAGGAPAPAGSQTQVGGTRVKLVDVYTDAAGAARAVVTVNGRSYEPREGDTFAQRFRLLSVDGDCATLLYGDNRFVLCEGEEIRK